MGLQPQAKRRWCREKNPEVEIHLDRRKMSQELDLGPARLESIFQDLRSSVQVRSAWREGTAALLHLGLAITMKRASRLGILLVRELQEQLQYQDNPCQLEPLYWKERK